MLSGCIILWANQKYLQIGLIETLFLPIVFCSIFAYLFFAFYSTDEKEKLNGNFTGYFIFSKEKIMAAKEEFDLNQIQKLEFHAFDFDGKKWVNPKSPDPKVSNGEKNFATIRFKDGRVVKFLFQQAYENEFENKMREILIVYHLKDKISFLALIQYIGISDSYERIQEFKMELDVLKESKG